MASSALTLWQRARLPLAPDVKIEELRHFDSSIDAVTLKSMTSTGYWCPHDAEFLNWRYFRHPANSYVALAGIIDDAISGYGVVRLQGRRASLMDFAVPHASGPLAGSLLQGICNVAREAGCDTLDFFATRGWHFWPLLSRAGFIKRKRNIYRSARCPNRADVSREENWQLLPGDTDVG